MQKGTSQLQELRLSFGRMDMSLDLLISSRGLSCNLWEMSDFSTEKSFLTNEANWKTTEKDWQTELHSGKPCPWHRHIHKNTGLQLPSASLPFTHVAYSCTTSDLDRWSTAKLPGKYSECLIYVWCRIFSRINVQWMQWTLWTLVNVLRFPFSRSKHQQSAIKCGHFDIKPYIYSTLKKKKANIKIEPKISCFTLYNRMSNFCQAKPKSLLSTGTLTLMWRNSGLILYLPLPWLYCQNFKLNNLILCWNCLFAWLSLIDRLDYLESVSSWPSAL